jgi:hypothetical protein
MYFVQTTAWGDSKPAKSRRARRGLPVTATAPRREGRSFKRRGGGSVAEVLDESVVHARGDQGSASRGRDGSAVDDRGAFSKPWRKRRGFYFAFGEDDAYVIAEFPDSASAVAASATISASGAVTLTTIPLLTAEEVDEATQKAVDYRPPGA